jgi:hypothetical protein
VHKQISIPLSFVFFSLLIFEGCSSPAPKKISSALVRTYAELLVMHEKEKIVGSTPDSLYRLNVKEFFAARKINEEDFQKEVTQISRNDVAWRVFLNEATAAVDSIKAAKPVQR